MPPHPTIPPRTLPFNHILVPPPHPAGVLLLYKSDRLVGPVWSLSLAGTAVAADLVHARQLQLLLPGSVLHLRAATSAACEAWRAALEQSAATLARWVRGWVEEGGGGGGVGVGGAGGKGWGCHHANGKHCSEYAKPPDAVETSITC
jgi:hypothetical protein